MTGHVLRVTIEIESVRLKVECREPVGATCRQACARPGCDWEMPYPHVDEDGTTHGVGDMGECNDVLWIEAGDLEAAEYHDRAADGESLHDGMAIDLYWNCGDPEWRGVRVPADVPS